MFVIVVGLQGQPADGFALVQQPQGQDERKAKAGKLKHMPWRRSLWIWNAAGRPCGEETKETMKRRRKDGKKAEDDDRGEAKVRRELGGRGDWCDSLRVGAPIWRSHTSRWGRAGRCTYMVKPPGFFFFFCFPPSLPVGAGAPIW